MTEQVWFRGENGVLGMCDAAKLPEGIQHRLDRGDLVRVHQDGTVWAEPETLTPPAGDGPLPDGAPALPKRAESRAVWADFARSQGMDEAKAASLTKAELVAEFTREHG